jgi:metal-responsive CopG/Arc/MetJ family transcriptional regulator
MANDEKQVSFNCPTELLETFDRLIRGKYRDRTEAICAGMRLLLASFKEA